MKYLLSLLFVCGVMLLASAQYTYTLRVKNTKNQPMPNVEVTAENAAKNVVLKERTNANGEAVFNLVEPGTYVFSYLDVENVTTAEIREGYSGKFSRSVTYDPKGVFAEAPRMDRKGISFKTKNARDLRTAQGAAKVTVLIKELSGAMVPHVNLTIVSIKDQTKYEGKSNSMGQAVFYVPKNQTYEIDIDGVEGFRVITLPNFDGIEKSEVLFYTKTKVNETKKGDTIIQQGITQTKGTPTHVLFTLSLKDYEGNKLAGEAVYLVATTANRVYEATTDAAGNAKFMLLKGTDYIVNLKYESGICLVEAPVSQGFRTASASRRYRGSSVVEEMLAQQKAEMERAIVQMEQQKAFQKEAIKERGMDYEISFDETPIEVAETPVNYLKRTPEGFNVDFESSGPTGTPTVIGDKLFTQEGLHSTNYYCLDANTGKFVWGVELGEGGISPAVYQNGVLLINTASCTLYAIDAKTGKLLWSKWLADYVYSTPTADDRSVYVVYEHGGYPVTVSFDLKSGKFNWMQRVDDEAIACPVVDGDEVHVASQSGIYYVFDKESGELKMSSTNLKVVSSPTLTEKHIFVTVSTLGRENLVMLDRKTLKIKKKFSTTLEALETSGMRDVDETDQMNFNGSHPVVYQNKIVVVMDKDAIHAFDCSSEKLRWTAKVEVNSDQLPIIAKGKVIITAKSGEVYAYDLETGARKLIKKVSGEIEGQPIAKGGKLYMATGGMIAVMRILQRFEWNQWNKDATHNTYWREK